MGARIDDVVPVLQQRRARRWIDPNVEAARRVLWNAYQRGGLSEEELCSTLDRLEFASIVQWDEPRMTAGSATRSPATRGSPQRHSRGFGRLTMATAADWRGEVGRHPPRPPGKWVPH